MRKTILFAVSLLLAMMPIGMAAKTLHDLQQEFVNLRFGLFIHFGLPTYAGEDWPDPDLSVEVFNPTQLDCRQWADGAESANMSFGMMSVKHHSGFCMWDTETTDYSVMSSPLHRDVVAEFCEAMREKGMKVMFHYSILDTHARLRPHAVTRQHVEMIKAQLTELLTRYGDVTAICFDGWDAPWGRISYDDVPFDDIYHLIKTLQPDCLVMDMNSHKFPAEELFYTDIKFYERGAGQKIDTESNRLPAMSCLPIQRTWFWKEEFPKNPVKDPVEMMRDVVQPLNEAMCCFVLNVAPNREGRFDDNAVDALKEIGKIWQNAGSVATVPQTNDPITAPNIAVGQRAEGSWSWDIALHDFATDDDFTTCWESMDNIENPTISVLFDREQCFNTIAITDCEYDNLSRYRIEYRSANRWLPLFEGEAPTPSRVKLHRFDAPVWGDAVRLTSLESKGTVAIAELGVYHERR